MGSLKKVINIGDNAGELRAMYVSDSGELVVVKRDASVSLFMLEP